ncbi:hypothetical protein [Blautia producta]|uniref:hypothetical protein n=1 Tax=Blautia producta TaxID=33035 RepID=UPI0031B64375
MRIVYCFFASRRYWKNEQELLETFQTISKQISGGAASVLVTENGDLEKLPEGDCLAAIPMSGAMQACILKAAELYGKTVLYAAYVRGNAPDKMTQRMLRNNAAPTVMDTWAVLRRGNAPALFAMNEEELARSIKIMDTYIYVQNAKLLLIGETEPWVVSNSSDLGSYEQRFGVKLQHVRQEELAGLYHRTTNEQALVYYRYFSERAQEIIEPTEEDLWNASRMAAALTTLLEKYNAQGCALACFDLLKEGTNSCLAVSYVNDCTAYLAACEGDLDSAVTMLLMKKLTSGRCWMANPGLQPDRTINFSHCTAPICATGGKPLPCILRSHHESGIGVSLQVSLPVDRTVTICRISDEASKITIQRGITIRGAYECACRTQLHVEMEDPLHYLDTVLGCHQVIAFDDITDELQKLAGLFGLEIL